MSTPKEIFDRIGANVAKNPEKATSLNAVFKFELSGDDGGTWTVDLQSTTTESFVIEGDGAEPKVTILMSAEDFSGAVSGKVNPMQAFMMGKIKVKGDMGLATKLQNIIALGKD